MSAISTARHIAYATGYLQLGMLDEASDEMEAIDFADRFLPSVLLARVELHFAAEHWDVVIGVARELTTQRPEIERGWIAWAYALRELQRVGEAKQVLLAAEPLHGKESGILHYNLACYHCLLGDLELAKLSLSRACKMESSFKADALDDADLKALWDTWSPPV